MENNYTSNLNNSKDALVRDGNMNSVQIGSSFQTNDYNLPMPTQSPVSFGGGLTIFVPPNATEFIFYASNVVDICENIDFESYFTVPTGATMVINCARMQYIFLETNGEYDVTLNFYFTLV